MEGRGNTLWKPGSDTLFRPGLHSFGFGIVGGWNPPMPVQATLPAGIHTVWSALTHPTPLARWSGRSSPLNGVRDPSERPLFEVQEPFERLEVRWPTSRGSVLDEIVLEEIDDRTTSLTWALFGDPPVRSYDLSDVAYVRAWMLRDALVGRPWADTLDYAAPIRGSVNRSMVIRAPLERVWVALTTVEDVARWLSGREGEIELEEGGNFDSGWRSDRG